MTGPPGCTDALAQTKRGHGAGTDAKVGGNRSVGLLSESSPSFGCPSRFCSLPGCGRNFQLSPLVLHLVTTDPQFDCDGSVAQRSQQGDLATCPLKGTGPRLPPSGWRDTKNLAFLPYARGRQADPVRDVAIGQLPQPCQLPFPPSVLPVSGRRDIWTNAELSAFIANRIGGAIPAAGQFEIRDGPK